MTQGEKDLLLKDLCARIPYDPFVKIGNNPNLFRLSTRLHWIVNYGSTGTAEEAITDGTSICKPYLRSMSSMTEEEEEEFNKIKLSYHFDEDSYILFDWLNEHHFDYRGLIEEGLALKAPEGMYKTK